MQIRADTWLSSIMDREVLRVDSADTDPSPIERITADISTRKRAFYYAKVDADRVDVVHQLSLAGFFVVDVNVTFAAGRAATPRPADTPNVTVVDCRPEDAAGVLDIAGSCFRYTRFHLDPLVPDALAHRIKREWIANYVAKNRGHRLFAALVDGKPAGFLATLTGGTAEQSVATIDLVGVDASRQRQSVGAALVGAFLREYKDHHVLQVGTQVANIPSVRLYEKLGFSLTKSQYVMHMHVREGQVER